ncbi:MAG: hypothetical protein ACPGQL_09860 [Thermoplasmatota archaeon]
MFTMFTELLIGILLLTSLVLLVLLVRPRPNDDIRAAGLPLIGLVATILIAALALLAG